MSTFFSIPLLFTGLGAILGKLSTQVLTGNLLWPTSIFLGSPQYSFDLAVLFIGNPLCLSIKNFSADNKSELPVAFDFGHTDDKLQTLMY